MKNAHSIREFLLASFQSSIDALFPQRAIKETDSWSGSASNYPTTEAYCKACLINVNIGDPADWKQSHCKLPIRGPRDREGTYVRKAVYAAAGGRGISAVTKPEDVSQAKWDAAVKAAANKLISAYSQMDETAPDSVYKAAGKTPPEKKRSISGQSLIEQVHILMAAKDEYAWILDVYFDDSGDLFAIVSSKGKLYRVNIEIGDNDVKLGEWIEVVIEFPPVAGSEETPSAEVEEPAEEPVAQSRMILRQQPDGRYRWISISCSSVLNRMGEIDSRQLFDRFIQHAQESGVYPIRQFYHAGSKFRTGQCDFIGRDEYLLITSGIYDNSELAQREIAARLKDPDYWGDSIGFSVLAEPVMINIGAGIQLPVYTDGVFYEISTLPETRAASWMTATPTVKEVTRMLSKEQMAQFIKLFDGDEAAAAKWLEDHAAVRNRQIEQQGVITREITPPVLDPPPAGAGDHVELQDPEAPPAEKPAPEGETDSEVLTDLEMDKEMFNLLAEQIGERLGIKALADEIAAIKETLATLQEGMGSVTEAAEEIRNRLALVEADDDEKRKIWLQDLPPKRTLRVTHRPRTPIQDEQPQDEARKSSEIAASLLDRIPVRY